MTIIFISVLLYIISFIICILYIRYNDSDSEWDRKSILYTIWIPILNTGSALVVIVSTITRFLDTDEVYDFIRKGRNGAGRV